MTALPPGDPPVSYDGYLIHSYTHAATSDPDCRYCALPDGPVEFTRTLAPEDPDGPFRLIETITLIGQR